MSDAGTARGTFDRVLPGLSVLRRYRRRWLRADVLAGVTFAAYLIPHVMAYAEVAGLPPVQCDYEQIGEQQRCAAVYVRRARRYLST